MRIFENFLAHKVLSLELYDYYLLLLLAMAAGRTAE